jgi:hypothetical protein
VNWITDCGGLPVGRFVTNRFKFRYSVEIVLAPSAKGMERSIVKLSNVERVKFFKKGERK